MSKPGHYFLLALLLVLIFSLRMLVSIFTHPLRIGWDPALHLQCAELITMGKIPYVDMFDVNPPLIWYLDTIPAYFSKVWQVPQTLTFNLFLVGLMAVSALLSSFVIFRRLPANEIKDRELLYLGLICGLLFFNFHLRYDFGQREEIFVLFYFPYLLLRYARYLGSRFNGTEAALIGVFGSIGICLKHYFVLVAFFVELVLFIALRRRGETKSVLLSPENMACLVFALLYAGHFLLAPPAMYDNYFHFLIPAFAKGYQFWDTCLANSLGACDKRGVFFLLCAGSALSLLVMPRYKVLLPLTVFSLLSVIPYLMQFKGWNYHDIPVFAGACILLTCLGGIVVDRLGKLPIKDLQPVMPILTVCLIAGYSLVNALEEINQTRAERQFDLARLGFSTIFGLNLSSPYSDIDSPFTETLLKYAKAKDNVLFISNGVSPGYPLLTQLALSPTSRHLHCCILSVLAFIKDTQRPTAEVKKLLAREPEVIAQYAEDIKKNRPPLIYIQVAPVSTYLEQYKFVETHMKDYAKLGEAANFYVYKRADL